MIPYLNEIEKQLARQKVQGGFRAIKEYRNRNPHITLNVAFRVVESYRDGFNDAIRFMSREK